MDTADHTMVTRTFWTALTFTKLPLTLLDVLIFGSLYLAMVLFNDYYFCIMSVILQLFAIVFAIDWVENRDNWKP
jgi:hypothetical protein